MSAIFDKAKADALKILGKDGDIPPLPPAIDKAGASMAEANKAFDKSREDVEAKLLAVQNANDVVRNGLKQYRAKLDKDDLGLDSKKKEDLKKIQQARKILTSAIDTGMKNRETDDKMLDEVDKHVIQLGKYKPGKDSF